MNIYQTPTSTDTKYCFAKRILPNDSEIELIVFDLGEQYELVIKETDDVMRATITFPNSEVILESENELEFDFLKQNKLKISNK
jgi:hypothetical protein